MGPIWMSFGFSNLVLNIWNILRLQPLKWESIQQYWASCFCILSLKILSWLVSFSCLNLNHELKLRVITSFIYWIWIHLETSNLILLREDILLSLWRVGSTPKLGLQHFPSFKKNVFAFVNAMGLCLKSHG
jgi:hypothetical protein